MLLFYNIPFMIKQPSIPLFLMAKASFHNFALKKFGSQCLLNTALTYFLIYKAQSVLFLSEYLSTNKIIIF